MRKIKELQTSIKWGLKELSPKGYLSLCLYILLGLFQSISILLLIPLLTVSDSNESILKNNNPLITQALFFFKKIGIGLKFENLLFYFITILTLDSLIKYYIYIIRSKECQGIENNLRKSIHHSYIDMEWADIAKEKSSDILNLITKEISRVASFVSSLIQFIGTIIIALFQLLIAFYISFDTTCLVIITITIILFIQKKTLLNSLSNGKRNISFSKVFQNNLIENFQNIKLVKSQYLGETQKIKLEQFSNDIFKNRLSFELDKAKTSLIYDLGTALLLCFFLYLGFVVFSIPTLNLILLVVIFSRILPAMKSSIENLQTLLNLAPTINEIDNYLVTFLNKKNKRANLKSKQYQLKNKIELCNIQFSYSNVKMILNNLSLVIEKNSVVVITGESGTGKTTLADILTGLLIPSKGTFKIDDKEISEIGLNNWGNSIGYMTQERFLFHTSIKNNMLWAKNDATDNEIWEALKLANVDEYILGLKSGIDTIVGDRGILISGGQRQRIALAMTLVRKPSLLILDEATNELDEKNETEILDEILKLKKSTTIFIITHKLSTIAKADHSYFLKNGELTKIQPTKSNK
ncbi:MAG: ABC transporter ATP-binding protein/permease [Bacteroidetes bacterium]|nr:ABC transporter ATP-binding protein/permease [Bacteroidota bacterium]